MYRTSPVRTVCFNMIAYNNRNLAKIQNIQLFEISLKINIIQLRCYMKKLIILNLVYQYNVLYFTLRIFELIVLQYYRKHE